MLFLKVVKVFVALQCGLFCCARIAWAQAADRQYLDLVREQILPAPATELSVLAKEAHWLPTVASTETVVAENSPPEPNPSIAAAVEELRELPLPSHTVEGYGGGAITPVAYLVNRGPEGTVFGRPAVSFANVVAGKKNVQVLAVTETLLRRIELGYALGRVDLGTLPSDTEELTGVDIGTHHLWVHNFNARLLLLDETAFGSPLMPSLTAGAHFKVNDGIEDIDDRLGGGLTDLGYDKNYGTSFTLTMSKTIIHAVTLNRPLFLSVGMRNSRDAQLGVLGFGRECNTTVEASVAYLITKHLLVNYEFRQKNSPYQEFPGLIGPEDNWHSVGMSVMLDNHIMINAGWAALGTVANTVENCAWYIQLKYEF